MCIGVPGQVLAVGEDIHLPICWASGCWYTSDLP